MYLGMSALFQEIPGAPTIATAGHTPRYLCVSRLQHCHRQMNKSPLQHFTAVPTDDREAMLHHHPFPYRDIQLYVHSDSTSFHLKHRVCISVQRTIGVADGVVYFLLLSLFLISLLRQPFHWWWLHAYTKGNLQPGWCDRWEPNHCLLRLLIYTFHSGPSGFANSMADSEPCGGSSITAKHYRHLLVELLLLPCSLVEITSSHYKCFLPQLTSGWDCVAGD